MKLTVARRLWLLAGGIILAVTIFNTYLLVSERSQFLS